MNVGVVGVPQADPGGAYRAEAGAIGAAIARVLESGWYILGGEGAAFEAEFAAWLGAGGAAQHAVGCGNGTDAIALALRGLGVGAGSTVVTVSHTAVATVAAIEMVGAVPLLLDIEPDTYTMDPTELAEVLERPPAGLPPVRAVVAVHLYGGACDLGPMLAACARAGVPLIEDVAQAHGATLGGRRLGTLGAAAAFSLYPTKNLGALGDAGVVTTGDAGLAADLAALRQYGWLTRYVSDLVGVNSRLDEVQAAVLRVRLPGLDAANARRRAVADAYDLALAGGPVAAPARRAGSEPVFHQYVVRCAEREMVQGRLGALGVGTAVHYPVPVHRQPAYAGRVALGPSGCRETERAAGEVLSLPMYPHLTAGQVERVCGALQGIKG